MQVTKIYQKFHLHGSVIQDQRLVISAKCNSIEEARTAVIDDLKIELFINGKNTTDLLGLLLNKKGVIGALLNDTDWAQISEVKDYEKEVTHA